jgi:LDH2 family malate/lactate/ureidoglycolate dehydrogenase
MKTEEQRFGYHQLCSALAQAIVAAGVAAEPAEVEAAIMVEADLQGVPSHGVRMLPGLLRGLADGRVNRNPDIRLLHEFAAVCRLDGDNGPGRYVARQAMDHAMERASRYGVGVCLAGRTTHWGRAHYYAAWAAQQGLIGICMTNGMPCMAIFGATGRVIGNNPLAIAIPRGKDENPVVLDMAMSQAAVGKVATWLREKRKIPENWGLDDQGRPSSDARDILGGAVLPFGGHKGAGLALMIELLTAGLAGGLFGNEIMAGDRSGLDLESSKLFMAIDSQAFGGREMLAARVDEYLAYLGEVTAGAESLTWPGRRGYEARAVNLVQGVPLHAEIVAELRAAGVVLPA